MGTEKDSVLYEISPFITHLKAYAEDFYKSFEKVILKT